MGISASTIAVVGLVMGGVKAWGEMQEAEERARAEEFNADVARQEAAMVRTRGRLDIMRQRKAAVAFRGTQEALYSKAGVEFTGSPLAVIQESAANAELDILTTEFNIYMGVSRLESEAREKERVAKAERRMGRMRAGKTLLTTAAKAALLYGGGGGKGMVPSGQAIRPVRGAESARSIGAIESMFR